jgi:hypothetical protein
MLILDQHAPHRSSSARVADFSISLDFDLKFTVVAEKSFAQHL